MGTSVSRCSECVRDTLGDGRSRAVDGDSAVGSRQERAATEGTPQRAPLETHGGRVKGEGRAVPAAEQKQ
jgi:hypothetical protein